MKRRSVINNLSLCLGLFVMGCANGPCRHNQPASAPEVHVDKFGSAPTEDKSAKSIQIFKYDGTKQCGQGKAVSLQQMESELKGIPVNDRMQKHDGLLRAQVCGTPTGQANVYEIPENFLAEAKKRGFEPWLYK